MEEKLLLGTYTSTDNSKNEGCKIQYSLVCLDYPYNLKIHHLQEVAAVAEIRSMAGISADCCRHREGPATDSVCS